MDVLKQLLDPTVLVAFITFVIAPIVGVLIAARQEEKGTEPAAPQAERREGSAPDPKVTSDRRIRKEDRQLVEALAPVFSTQQAKIEHLEREMAELRKKMADLLSTNAVQKQQIEVLKQQIRRMGETPFGAE